MRLLESMRAEGGTIALLDRHLARLRASADALGFELEEPEVRRRITEAVGERTGRVRLTLGAEGAAEVSVGPLLQSVAVAWLDPEPLAEAGSVVCVYKTTDRAHYARRLARARARGAEETILCNESGEVTEGTFTNVWAEVDGRLWTPPLAAGGLGGVFRAHVLDTDPRAGERPLTPADLRDADALYLSNAVRGWMRVRLVA